MQRLAKTIRAAPSGAPPRSMAAGIARARAARSGALSTAAKAAAPRAAPSANHVVPQDAIEKNGGLLEYSVVYTDRALNHMSQPFQKVMTDLHSSLCSAYNADHAVMLPGSGTYAMEAVARQLSPVEGPAALVVRNGWFSFRWTQIHAAI